MRPVIFIPRTSFLATALPSCVAALAFGGTGSPSLSTLAAQSPTPFRRIDIVALDAHVDVHLEPFTVVVWQVDVVQPLARAGSSCLNGALRLDLAPVVQVHLVRGDL